MKFNAVNQGISEFKGDALAVPCFEGCAGALFAEADRLLNGLASKSMRRGAFSGKAGEQLALFSSGGTLGARQSVPFRRSIYGALSGFPERCRQESRGRPFRAGSKKISRQRLSDRAAAEFQKLNAPVALKENPPAGEISRGSPVKPAKETDKRTTDLKPALLRRPFRPLPRINLSRRKRAFGS